MPGQPLIERHCAPVAKGTPVLRPETAQTLLKEIPGWEMVDGKAIRRVFRCKDFKDAVSLINRVCTVAESNDHHPDLHLTGYRNLTIEISTHSIGGLSDNDFVLAAKLDRILTHTPPIG